MALSGHETFVALVREHGRMLAQVVHAYARSEDERKDLQQEVLAQLWRAFPGYDSERRFSTWMYRIALNVAISSSRRRRELLRIDEAATAPAPDPSSTERDQQLRSLQRFVSSLPPLDRALVLLYLDERSQKEIAEVLGITESNVSTRIHRIKQRLREQLTGKEGEGP
jgi:RNA polymerase sigma-70 factor (ECF subfamily)